ncbi:unnamed protein product [Pleuronectes platessa]|uniref:Uncharacterized protein n=1 Tax=Pleuronectes platessa TaxID=8262 RepID=A0A9N7YFY2_PLEPL|nr:unnamed protein product [Pleuronectes platessa]
MPDPAGRCPRPTTMTTTLRGRRLLPSTAASGPGINHSASSSPPRPSMTWHLQPISGRGRDFCRSVAMESIRWLQLNNFHQQMTIMKTSPLQSQTRPASVHQGASGLTVVFRSPKDPEILQLSGADWRDEPLQTGLVDLDSVDLDSVDLDSDTQWYGPDGRRRGVAVEEQGADRAEPSRVRPRAVWGVRVGLSGSGWQIRGSGVEVLVVVGGCMCVDVYGGGGVNASSLRRITAELLLLLRVNVLLLFSTGFHGGEVGELQRAVGVDTPGEEGEAVGEEGGGSEAPDVDPLKNKRGRQQEKRFKPSENRVNVSRTEPAPAGPRSRAAASILRVSQPSILRSLLPPRIEVFDRLSIDFSDKRTLTLKGTRVINHPSSNRVSYQRFRPGIKPIT